MKSGCFHYTPETKKVWSKINDQYCGHLKAPVSTIQIFFLVDRDLRVRGYIIQHSIL